MASNPDRYRLSEADHQAIFEQDIKPDLFAGAKPSHQPVAVIFGGQPGAGKSAAVDSAMRELEPRGGAVQIIGDDLRGYHPHYARLMERDDKTAAFYTDRDTGQWVEKAIAEAKAQRVNIVIEGTMRDGNKVAATMESLRAAGYEIDARALAVNPRLLPDASRARAGFGAAPQVGPPQPPCFVPFACERCKAGRRQAKRVSSWNHHSGPWWRHRAVPNARGFSRSPWGQ